MKPLLYDAAGKVSHWTNSAATPVERSVLKERTPVPLEPTSFFSMVSEQLVGDRVLWPPRVNGELPFRPDSGLIDPGFQSVPGLPDPRIVVPKPGSQQGGFVTTAGPPLTVLSDRTEEEIQVRRARAAERLGGGPIVRARQDERARQEQEEDVKMMMNGLRKRPVL